MGERAGRAGGVQQDGERLGWVAGLLAAVGVEVDVELSGRIRAAQPLRGADGQRGLADAGHAVNDGEGQPAVVPSPVVVPGRAVAVSRMRNSLVRPVNSRTSRGRVLPGSRTTGGVAGGIAGRPVPVSARS